MEASGVFKNVCTGKRNVVPRVLEQTILLIDEPAREEREGRKLDAPFAGDSESIIGSSESLILPPCPVIPTKARHIANPDVRETLKELDQLVGVVSDSGVATSMARYINTIPGIPNVPLGPGSRRNRLGDSARTLEAGPPLRLAPLQQAGERPGAR